MDRFCGTKLNAGVTFGAHLRFLVGALVHAGVQHHQVVGTDVHAKRSQVLARTGCGNLDMWQDYTNGTTYDKGPACPTKKRGNYEYAMNSHLRVLKLARVTNSSETFMVLDANLYHFDSWCVENRPTYWEWRHSQGHSLNMLYIDGHTEQYMRRSVPSFRADHGWSYFIQ